MISHLFLGVLSKDIVEVVLNHLSDIFAYASHLFLFLTLKCFKLVHISFFFISTTYCTLVSIFTWKFTLGSMDFEVLVGHLLYFHAYWCELLMLKSVVLIQLVRHYVVVSLFLCSFLRHVSSSLNSFCISYLRQKMLCFDLSAQLGNFLLIKTLVALSAVQHLWEQPKQRFLQDTGCGDSNTPSVFWHPLERCHEFFALL